MQFKYVHGETVPKTLQALKLTSWLLYLKERVVPTTAFRTANFSFRTFCVSHGCVVHNFSESLFISMEASEY